jgi:limonene-1,2-epoxide hydrolase
VSETAASDIEAGKQLILALWKALSDRDWDTIPTLVSDDCIYFDVPVGPSVSARGGADIVKRLKIGLAPLTAYENHSGVLVGDGTDFIYEHSETWTFDSGEVAVLPFCTVHKVVDGKITVWKDYWDYPTLQRQAPADWLERMAGADSSWHFDATGLV